MVPSRAFLIPTLAWAGCTQIGSPSSEPSYAQPDASADGADGGPPASGGGYSEPRRIESVSAPGYEDDDPTLTGDLLEMYFNSSRPGGLGLGDLYVSVRSTIDDPWGEPQLVGGINTEYNETAPELASNGLTLWFSSDRPGGQGLADIYISKRASRTERWSAPRPVEELNSPQKDLSPTVDSSRTLVVFYSTRAGGDNDLFVATRPVRTEPWQPPEFLTSLNTSRSEADPFVGADGLSVHMAAGEQEDLDIYRASRDTRDGDFRIPAAVAEINTEFHEADPWVSASGDYMVLTSDRTGDNDIYETWLTDAE